MTRNHGARGGEIGSRRKDPPTGEARGGYRQLRIWHQRRRPGGGCSGSCSNTTLPPNAAPGGPYAVLWEKDGSVTDLGTLPGGAGNNVANAINDRGEIVGTALLSDGTVHSFLWSRQRGMQDPGLPGDDSVSVAGCCQTINNRGEVVGFSFPGPLGGGRAIVWVDKVPWTSTRRFRLARPGISNSRRRSTTQGRSWTGERSMVRCMRSWPRLGKSCRRPWGARVAPAE